MKRLARIILLLFQLGLALGIESGAPPNLINSLFAGIRRLKAFQRSPYNLEERISSFVLEVNLNQLFLHLIRMRPGLYQKVLSELENDIQRINQEQQRFEIELVREEPPVIRMEGSESVFSLVWLRINNSRIGIYYNRYPANPQEDEFGDLIYFKSLVHPLPEEGEVGFGILVPEGDRGFIELLERMPVDEASFVQYYGSKWGLLNIEKLDSHLDFLRSKGIEVAQDLKEDDLRRGVLKVLQPANGVLGSGFIFYADSSFYYGLTAAHVAELSGSKDLEVMIQGQLSEAQLVAIHPLYYSLPVEETIGYDLALFKVPRASLSLPVKPLELKIDSKEGPRAIIGLGYPRASSPEPYLFSFYFSRVLEEDPEALLLFRDTELALTSAGFNGEGLSGGPIIDLNSGVVIGLRRSQRTGLSAKVILDFIRKYLPQYPD